MEDNVKRIFEAFLNKTPIYYERYSYKLQKTKTENGYISALNLVDKEAGLTNNVAVMIGNKRKMAEVFDIKDLGTKFFIKKWSN